jgi:hypothetical protein
MIFFFENVATRHGFFKYFCRNRDFVTITLIFVVTKALSKKIVTSCNTPSLFSEYIYINVGILQSFQDQYPYLFEQALKENRPVFVDYFLRSYHNPLRTTAFIKHKNTGIQHLQLCGFLSTCI